jgi:hypothetical protein
MRWIMWGLATVVACSDSGGGADAPPTTDATADTDGAPPVDAAVTCPAPDVVDNATAGEVTVAGDVGSTLGIFDPSIVYPGDAPAGAMAYSSVPTQETIRTRLAVSADAGATWTFVREANVAEPATLASPDCGGTTCSGNLISEVSSLVYDADDPDPARRWKLFAHRYLVGPGVALHYTIGTITLQTAAAVDGAWTAPQKHLGWTSASGPYSSTGVATNVSSLAGMADCVALTEPSAMWLPGSLHLAVGCVYLDGTYKIRVELLRSTDHAASWQRAGTLLRADDASCLTAGASINAPELFAHEGTVYVAATPSDAGGYHGCVVVPVDDLSTASVRRDDTGAAWPARSITTTPERFHGACAFAAGAGGYVLAVGFLGAERPFRIFRTGIADP